MQDNVNLFGAAGSAIDSGGGNALIVAKNIRKRFGSKHILNGIDLQIEKGERIVIIGPSGSGKSTFLRCLNLLEPPTTGEIYFEGNKIFGVESVRTDDKIRAVKDELRRRSKKAKKQDSAEAKDRTEDSELSDKFCAENGELPVEQLASKLSELKSLYKRQRQSEREFARVMDKGINIHRQRMGMVFQQFNLFPHLTVMKNITLAPVQLGKMTEAEAKAKAETYLKRIGLAEKADSYPGQLSGGQMQRIAIVRSLVMNPDVMLFDEPTSALDPEMVGEVLDFIRELAGEGMTMAIVTHEMNFAREIATKVLFMDEGRILEQRPPKEFFASPENPRLQDFLSKVLKN